MASKVTDVRSLENRIVFCLLVPSSYPINFGLSSLDSTSIRASWDPVPKDNRNGEIIGYRLKYRKISNFLSRKRREASDNQEPWDGEVEVHPDNNLRIFTALDKAATYLVRLQAFTRVGEGNFTELTVTTGESGRYPRPPLPSGYITIGLSIAVL